MSDCSVEGGLQSIQLPTVVAFSDTDAPLACVCVCVCARTRMCMCVCVFVDLPVPGAEWCRSR